MDKPFKFVLPSPNFNKTAKDACKAKPHFLTPSGMSLLPREKQPPPMYGKHGATVPPRYLHQAINEKQFVAVTPATPDKQYCEPCELELNSLEDLKRHRAQHEKCPVAGCLYKGHPSVMDKHINALHASGLFDKFKRLSTPVEIAAWREERRKRYPTLANVLLKQKAQEQRQKRGERLEINKNRFGKVNDKKRAQLNTQKKVDKNNPEEIEEKNNVEEKKPREENKANPNTNRRNRKNKRNQRTKNNELKLKVQNKDKQNNEKKEEENEVYCGGIKMFGGTTQLKNYKHFNKTKSVTNNALYGLVGMYGSDDDEESENDDGASEDENVIEQVTEENESSTVVKTLDENVNLESRNLRKNSTELNNEEMQKVSSMGDNLPPATKSKDNREMAIVSPDDNPLNTSVKVNEIVDEYNKNGFLNLNDNSSDDAPEEIPIQRILPDNLVKTEANTKKMTNEEPAEKRSKQMDQPTKFKQKYLVKRKSGLDYRKARLRKQNTMLEKLLENDIRHERNVLLQCVRYVCENNFFGIGQYNQENPG